MWIESRPTSRAIVLAAIILLSTATLVGQEITYPRIPVHLLDKYKVTEHEEVVEMMTMTRVRIKGRKEITFDPVPNMMLWDKNPGQARFYHRAAPQLTFEILSFPVSAFRYELSEKMLEEYLKGQEKAFVERNFEVIEPPELGTGPAKFRILGERALTLRYAFDTEQGRLLRGENWLEKDDMIHVVVIDGTPELFDNHFKRIKAGLNSMTYLKN
ncbi:MAG: hypothetical protein AAF065_14225 [Verrucomicrobiota bacterium]